LTFREGETEATTSPASSGGVRREDKTLSIEEERIIAETSLDDGTSLRKRLR